jgi:hypothetical protein
MEREHECVGGEVRTAEVRWVTDGFGIPMVRVCNECVLEKVARYRTDIFTRYECDEVIDPEDVL